MVKNKSGIKPTTIGFTIVELLIVIVVIGILAAITIVAYNGIQGRAQTAAVSSALEQTAKKLALYVVDNGGSYPTDLATIGITNSSTSYQYSVNNSVTPQTYCVTATNGTTSYKVSSTTTAPTSGGCAGHGVGGVGAVTNLATNPSFENGAGYSGSNASATQSLTWVSHGIYSLVITPNSSTINDSYAAIGGDSGSGMKLGMQAGKTYTISAKLHIPVSLTGSLYTGRSARITAWQNAGGYSFQSAGGTTTAGDYSLSVTFTLSASATEAFVRLYNGAYLGGGSVYYDSIMLTEGTSQYNYADGSSSDWVWNGTANNSTSTGPPL